MKQVIGIVLSCALSISAMAAPAPQGKTTKTKHAKKESGADVSRDVQELKDAVAAQQQQIQQLIQQVTSRDQQIQQLQQKIDQNQTATSEAQSKAESAASQASEQAQTVNNLKTDVAGLKTTSTSAVQSLQESQREVAKTSDAIKALEKLKFSGDLRLRYEPFFGGGAINKTEPDLRQRERFRLRFNVNTKITDDFSAGFSLASGDLGDPVSTNSTLTGFYTRKPIAVDRAFGVYNPHQFKPFSLTVGKFGYTWLRTELTWDNDLNPEGASAAVSYDWKNQFIDHFGIVAFGTPIFESGGGPDTYMTGGQIQTGWTLLPKLKLTADGTYYYFDNIDPIAQNQTQVPADGFATQGLPNDGGGSFGFSASSLTNNFGTIGGKRVFASKYGLVDAIGRLDFDTGNKRWPVYALIDFVQNTRACDNLRAFINAGEAVPTCDPHQRHGYWAELKAGQTKNKGDLLLGYTFARIERDAVLSAFNFSDLRQPTNVIEHRIEVYYQAYPHVQIGWTGLIGRQIVTDQSLTPERWLKRFQFDTIFSF